MKQTLAKLEALVGPALMDKITSIYIRKNYADASWDQKDLSPGDRRHLKRVFAFKASGDPPYVMLRGKVQVGDTLLLGDIGGAFECRITSSREVEVEVEAVPAQPAKRVTRVLNEYSCVPALTEED